MALNLQLFAGIFLFCTIVCVQGHRMNVKKCCPSGQIMVELDDQSVACRVSNTTQWAPPFLKGENRTIYFEPVQETNEFGDTWTTLCARDPVDNDSVCLTIIPGLPECGPVRAWPVYSYPGSPDGFDIRHGGILRHTVLNDLGKALLHYDYTLDQYCVDGIELLHGGARTSHGFPDPTRPTPAPVPFFYAILCDPGHQDSVDFFKILANFVYPIGLGIGILLLIFLVVVHVALREIRDLSGCMLASLVAAFLLRMSFKLIAIVADDNSRLNLLVVEVCMHGADVAAHFWLNSLGHRAWLALRHPRREATRPEGRRFFLYSIYTWGSALATLGMSLMLWFMNSARGTSPHSVFTWYLLGWLGISVFIAMNAFLLLANVYFYAATRIAMKKQTSYGRTFHRNKGFSQLFTRLFIIIETVWFFQCLALTQYAILLGLSIIADILLPVLLVWGALKGRRVMHLMKLRLQNSRCMCCKRVAPRVQQPQYFGEELKALGTSV